jgi:endonuclease IV
MVLQLWAKMRLKAADERIRRFALKTMEDDLKRMEYLPGNLYNFHPDCHVGQGVDIGIDFISNALNTILKLEQNTIVLLETMAGKGSEIGRSFEELHLRWVSCNNAEEKTLENRVAEEIHLYSGR